MACPKKPSYPQRLSKANASICDREFGWRFAVTEYAVQALFEREFGRHYDWFIRSEHINLPWEIRSELEKRFDVVEARYFPFRIPSVSANLIIGLTMRPRG